MSSFDLFKLLECLEVTSNETCSSFTCFPKLPPELRLKIFGFMMDEPRTLMIALMKGGNPYSPLTCRLQSYHTEPMAVLSLCHESRAEALRTYPKIQKSFDSKFFDLRINFEFDTDYFDQHSAFAVFLALAEPTGLDLVQSLAVTINFLCLVAIGIGRLDMRYVEWMSRFRNLSHFTLFVGGLRLPWYEPPWYRPYESYAAQEGYMLDTLAELEWVFNTILAKVPVENSSLDARNTDLTECSQ